MRRPARSSTDSVDPAADLAVSFEATSPGEGRLHARRIRCTGEEVYRHSFRYTPRPLSSADRERILDELTDRLDPTGEAPGLRREVATQVDLPPTQPPVTEIVLGADGTAWLRREELHDDPHDTWFVLSPEGRFVARVEVPRDLRLLMLQGSRVLATSAGSLDLPYLHVFSVERQARR